MPKALDEYRFFWSHLDKKYIDYYGYLDGIAMSFGPVELAAVILGHGNFYMNLVMEPNLMHELLKITTESVIKWLRAHEEINGPLKRLGIADHIAGQVSQEHFEEFWLPYTANVLAEFSEAMVFYHNEFPIPYLNAMSELKADVFHFGSELQATKKVLGKKMTLMGNLSPVDLLLEGTSEQVEHEALVCLEKGTPGGRFLLSSGGGLSPGTPVENVKAMESALDRFKESRSLPSTG